MTLASIRESAGDARDGMANVANETRSLEEQVAALERERLSEDVGSIRRLGDELGSAMSGISNQSGKLSELLSTAIQEAEQLSEDTREARSMIRVGRGHLPSRLLQRLRGAFVRRRNRVTDAESP